MQEHAPKRGDGGTFLTRQIPFCSLGARGTDPFHPKLNRVVFFESGTELTIGTRREIDEQGRLSWWPLSL